MSTDAEIEARELRHIGHLIDEARSLAVFQDRDTRDAMATAALAAVEPLIRERLALEIEAAKRKPIDAAVRRAVADHPTTPYVVDQTLKAAARIVRGDAS